MPLQCVLEYQPPLCPWDTKLRDELRTHTRVPRCSTGQASSSLIEVTLLEPQMLRWFGLTSARDLLRSTLNPFQVPVLSGGLLPQHVCLSAPICAPIPRISEHLFYEHSPTLCVSLVRLISTLPRLITLTCFTLCVSYFRTSMNHSLHLLTIIFMSCLCYSYVFVLLIRFIFHSVIHLRIPVY